MNDPGDRDELAAALHVVGDLLTKAAADDLRSFLAGEAKTKIVLPGWRDAARLHRAECSLRSVADIPDETSLAKVREHRQSMKART